MESEYMSAFKRVYDTDSVRRSFREKVDYRKQRRKREQEHQHILQEDDMAEKKEKEIFQENIGIGDGPVQIPTLDLRPTPSPSPRQNTTPSSGLEDLQSAQSSSQRERSPSRIIRSQATQTTSEIPPFKISSPEARISRKKVAFDGGMVGRRSRNRSRSPFAAFGIGDRERSTSGKRTFNIKASNGGQVYETAIRAATRKGFPLPQKSRKAELLDIRKPSKHHRSPVHRSRSPCKKQAAFDHY